MTPQLLDRSLPPAIESLKQLHFPRILSEKLGNGIEVLLVPFGKQPVVELLLMHKGGRCFETHPGTSGLAASMLLEGNKKATGYEFAMKLDEYGAFLNAESGFESGLVHLTSLEKHIPNTLPLLAETVMEPAFQPAEFDSLQQRSLQRLEVSEKKTSFIARREFNRALFGGESGYGKIVGKEQIAALEIDMLREFHARTYAPANWLLVAAGGFDPDALLKQLNHTFGSRELIDSGAKIDPATSSGNQPMPAARPGLHYFEHPDSMQGTVRIGHRGIRRGDPDYYRIQVVSTILGGYFGSRLNRNIREEKGFTYGIGSAWVSYKYAGAFLVQADVGNENIRPTLKEIRYEINKLISEGVTTAELDLVKNYMLGRILSERERPSQIARTAGNLRVNDVPLTQLDEKFGIISSMTPGAVQEICAAHFHPDEIMEVVCGKLESPES